MFKAKSKSGYEFLKFVNRRERLIPNLPPKRVIAMNNTPYHMKVGYLYKLQEKLTLMKLWTNVSTKIYH